LELHPYQMASYLECLPIVRILDLKSAGRRFESSANLVVNTHVPLSPSSIIWYQPMGADALWLGR